MVGNFAGPKALRAKRQGVWPAFCANVAALPLDDASVFIRPNNTGRFDPIAAEAGACGSGR